MPSTLTDIRCRMIQPMFDYIKDSIELERRVEHSNSAEKDAEISKSAANLARMMSDLDDRDRRAILAVLRHETSVLIIACMANAATLKIERDAGLS